MGKEPSTPALPVSQAAKLSGLSEHMLTYLGRYDVLTPSGSSGRGKRRLYTFNDIVFLKLVADLLGRGIQIKGLKKGLDKARQEAGTWGDIRKAPHRYLVTDGTELFVRRPGELESKTMNGQLAFAFVLDIRPISKAVALGWPKEPAPGRQPQRALKGVR